MPNEAVSLRGPFIPTLTTHGTITSLTDPSRPKVMIGKEWLIAMGEPLGGASDVFENFVGPALSALPVVDQKKLAGNSFDASAYGFFALYFLSNIARKDGHENPASASSSSGSGGVTMEAEVPFADVGGTVVISDDD